MLFSSEDQKLTTQQINFLADYIESLRNADENIEIEEEQDNDK